MEEKAKAKPIFLFTTIVLLILFNLSIILNFVTSQKLLRLNNEYQTLANRKDFEENKEIERKWLVKRENIPYDLDKDGNKYELVQTYLNFSPEVRVRNISDKRYVMAVKTGLTEKKGLSRDEYQFDLTKEEYEHLLEKQEGNTIYKSRTQINIDQYTYAFDIFHEQLDGLAYIEIEFPSEEEANSFQAPDWFGKDVTNDKKYKNQSLAQFGIPESYEQDSKE